MTGKELLMALLGAGAVGGAAGVAANVAMPAKETARGPDATVELTRRLEAAEKELASAREALEASRLAQMSLEERFTKSEIAAAHRASASRPAADAAKPRVGRFRMSGSESGAFDLEKHEVESLDEIALGGRLLDEEDLGGQIAVELGSALEGIEGLGAERGAELRAGLESLRNGFALRRLPEAERWEKARTDLGLSWNQVEELKQAVAERDKAIQDAMTTETKTSHDGGKITIKRPDAAKRAHAEAAYHDRVNAALDDETRRNWQSKGYDHAFGSGPVGGSMAIAIDMRSETQGETPKDAAK